VVPRRSCTDDDAVEPLKCCCMHDRWTYIKNGTTTQRWNYSSRPTCAGQNATSIACATDRHSGRRRLTAPQFSSTLIIILAAVLQVNSFNVNVCLFVLIDGLYVGFHARFYCYFRLKCLRMFSGSLSLAYVTF